METEITIVVFTSKMSIFRKENSFEVEVVLVYLVSLFHSEIGRVHELPVVIKSEWLTNNEVVIKYACLSYTELPF